MKQCKNCGAPEDLHHYQTNQCPVGGREAPVGRMQGWMSTVFECADSEIESLRSEVRDLRRRIQKLESMR
jgi:hypothetical protein